MRPLFAHYQRVLFTMTGSSTSLRKTDAVPFELHILLELKNIYLHIKTVKSLKYFCAQTA